MRAYAEQPREQLEDDKPNMDGIRKIINEGLMENLPDCSINNWFLESVYYANMLDNIIQTIWDNVGRGGG